MAPLFMGELLACVTSTMLRFGRVMTMKSFVIVPVFRDAIAKALYSRLFTWLVDRTNSIVAHNQHRNTSIALLDIFGFEVRQHNKRLIHAA